MQTLGAIFWSQTTLGAIFTRIFRAFAQIFSKSKLLGVRLQLKWLVPLPEWPSHLQRLILM